jgi:hypothetical protein
MCSGSACIVVCTTIDRLAAKPAREMAVLWLLALGPGTQGPTARPLELEKQEQEPQQELVFRQEEPPPQAQRVWWMAPAQAEPPGRWKSSRRA